MIVSCSAAARRPWTLCFADCEPGFLYKIETPVQCSPSSCVVVRTTVQTELVQVTSMYRVGPIVAERYLTQGCFS